MKINDYYGAFIFGVVLSISFLSLFYIIYGSFDVKNKNSPKEKSPEPTIEVIDSYKGCDILRYAPPSGAKYQYFMDCNK